MSKARDLASVGSVASQGLNFRNKIINGDMRIDQRNAGAIINLNGSLNFPVDRFGAFGRLSGGATATRSTVAPPGFTNSLLYTSTSSGSVPNDTYPCIVQNVEGFNTVDFGWGTANAQPVTISFWVRSSVTGTYAFSVRNNPSSHSYVAQYTINAANTWEQKTITIAGVTAGTWNTGNGKGAELMWDMGFGFGNTTTPNTWSTDNLYRVASNVRLVETNGATFYLTGVQLEKGTAATPFEMRPYGTELALCQRYYEKSYDIETAPATNTNNGNTFTIGRVSSGSVFDYCTTIQYKVPKRATPTVSFWSAGGTPNLWNATSATELPKFNASSSISFSVYFNAQTGLTAGQAAFAYGHWVSSAEL